MKLKERTHVGVIDARESDEEDVVRYPMDPACTLYAIGIAVEIGRCTHCIRMARRRGWPHGLVDGCIDLLLRLEKGSPPKADHGNRAVVESIVWIVLLVSVATNSL